MRKNTTLGRQIYPSFVGAALLAMVISFYYLVDIFNGYLNRQSEEYSKAQAMLVERLFQGKFDIVNTPEIDATLKEIGPDIRAE